MSNKKRKELIIQLNSLSDEHEILQEEFYRLQEQDKDTDEIESDLATLEVIMGEIEIELELLRT